MSATELRDQLEQLGKADPEFARSQAARIAALERFSELGLPNRRLETWHYTDLSALAGKGFSFQAPAPAADTLERVRSLLTGHGLSESMSHLVFIDGRLSDTLSAHRDIPGLTVHVDHEHPGVGSDSTALTALNAAFAPVMTRLEFASDVTAPINLVFVGTGRKLAPQLRLGIKLAAGSPTTITQRFIDLPDAGEAWLNLVVDIALDRDSELTLHRLQLHERDQYQTTLSRARVGPGAKLMAGNVELGGKLVRNEFEIGLEGSGAEADVYSLSLTRDRQHADTRISVAHQAPQTTSRQSHRAILADASRSVFNGKVIVEEHAQHVEARQRSDSLLLSARAEADAKPELEIHADQVICSHGATVGELSDEHLFYLRSRGIDAPTARGILTAAFADEILDRIELESFRGEARRLVGDWLPREIEAP